MVVDIYRYSVILLFKKVGKLNSNVTLYSTELALTFRNCTLLQSGGTQNGNSEVADLYNGK